MTIYKVVEEQVQCSVRHMYKIYIRNPATFIDTLFRNFTWRRMSSTEDKRYKFGGYHTKEEALECIRQLERDPILQPTTYDELMGTGGQLQYAQQQLPAKHKLLDKIVEQATK
jgi:hypothetical protein